MSDLRVLMAATANPKPRPVPTKAWGTVHVRPVTVAELEEQKADTVDWKDKRRIARGAARVICTEGGTPIFDPDDQADVDLIAAQPWALLKQVIDAAEEFNGTSAAGVEAAKNG